MESQDVEYDSVADLRVAVSDNEEDEYFVVDGVMEDAGSPPTGTVQAGAATGLSTTQSRASGPQVSGSATTSWSRGDVSAVDPRVGNVTSAGVAPSEPSGFLSAISRRLLPSFLQQGRPQNAPVMTGVTSRPAVRPTEAGASRVATPATSGPRGPGAPYDPRYRSPRARPTNRDRRRCLRTPRRRLRWPTRFLWITHTTDQLLPVRQLRRSYRIRSAHTESCQREPPVSQRIQLRRFPLVESGAATSTPAVSPPATVSTPVALSAPARCKRTSLQWRRWSTSRVTGSRGLRVAWCTISEYARRAGEEPAGCAV